MTRSALLLLLALLMLPWAAKAQSPGTLQAQEIDSPNGEIKLGSPVVGFQDKGGQVYNVKAYGAKGDGRTDDTASIQNAINAMPACIWGSTTWSHCGTVLFPNGVYYLGASLKVSSPHVILRGISTGGTVIDFHGATGCAVEWTANPYNAAMGDTNSGGLFNMKVNGASAGSGTCGLDTYDINGLEMDGVTIANFHGDGSAGWRDQSVKYWNERFRVFSLELANNTISWQIKKGAGSGGTFGYGIFDIWINVAKNQTSIDADGGVLSYSNLNVIVNGRSGTTSTGFNLHNKANWYANLTNIHMELGHNSTGGNNIGFALDSTSRFIALGSVDEYLYMTDSIASGAEYSILAMTSSGAYFSILPYPQNFKQRNAGFEFGASSDCGTAAMAEKFCEPANTGNWGVIGLYQAGNLKFGIASDGSLFNSNSDKIALPAHGGTLNLSGANGVSAGSITLSGGAGSHAFAKPYESTPVCMGSDASHAMPVRVLGTATEVTVTGTGSDVVNWICTPATN
jgi:hypothetical protein